MSSNSSEKQPQATRVYAGIDEAGYGPRLGPLVIGCAVFRTPAPDPGEHGINLWAALAPAVVRAGDKSNLSRIPIDDSKKLKLANTSPLPLQHLERGVLPCLGLLDRLPGSGRELLEALGLDDQAAHDAPEPAATALDPDQIKVLTNTLRRAMRASQTELEGLTCVALDAPRFNQAIRELGPKSEVSFSAVSRFLRGIWKKWGHEHPLVAIDRQGGRKHYGAALARAIRGATVTPIIETDEASAYEVKAPSKAGEPARRLTVRFEVGGDDRHLPIALASMSAKLVRERLMMRFNERWAARAPQVKPTAGYGVDARRWIDEIKPLISEDELRSLVRLA